MNRFNKDIEEFNIEDIQDALLSNVKKDIKTFEDYVDLRGSLNREIVIGDITGGLGVYVNGMISFWNEQDEKDNIPAEERKPIKLYIDSNGGSLMDCFTICDSIKMSKTPVWTIVVGCAYSAAFDICTFGHKRFAYPHATFLFHEGGTGMSGTIGQFQNFAAFNKRLIEKTKKYLIENTKITEEKYKEVKTEDWWLDAEEALEWGVIDEITEVLL